MSDLPIIWENLGPVAHVYHEWTEAKPHINVKLVRNTKSVTWEITALNAATVEEALALITAVEDKLIEEYGTPTNGG